MRKIFLFATTCCLLQSTFAESIFPAQLLPATILVQPQTEVIPVNTVHKRMTLKERLQVKLSQKIKKEKSAMKTIKTLASITLILSILSPVAVAIGWPMLSPFILLLGGIFFLTAIITGPIAFIKWKKLPDKTGIKKAGFFIKILMPWILIFALFLIIILF